MAKGKCWHVSEPKKTPNRAQAAWAAGFIEGDGCIGVNGTTVEISVTQNYLWPLEQLRVLFGGSIGRIKRQGIKKATYWRWRVSGSKARRAGTVIELWLSPRKRKQMEKFDVY